MVTSTPPRLLKVPEVGKLLGFGRSRAYELVARGIIPSIRVSPGSIRVPEDALRKWIQEQTTGGEDVSDISPRA